MQRAGNRGGYIQGPQRVVRELGPEEEGLRGGGGEERDCGGGEQGLSVNPYQGADGPKVMGQGRARDNIGEKGGAIRERDGTS
jgi:hypothetical protein